MTSPKRFQNLLLEKHPLNTEVSETFYWDPNKSILFHRPVTTAYRVHSFAHEMGHAISKHQRYYYDVDLLMLEKEAWLQARELINSIEKDYFQDRIANKHLRGYADWLTERSRCERCLTLSLQSDDRNYNCRGCGQRWCYPLGDSNLNSHTVI